VQDRRPDIGATRAFLNYSAGAVGEWERHTVASDFTIRVQESVLEACAFEDELVVGDVYQPRPRRHAHEPFHHAGRDGVRDPVPALDSPREGRPLVRPVLRDAARRSGNNFRLETE
jgi:hypothetical protein